MPYALNHESQVSRPTKRRKVSSEEKMAAFQGPGPDKAQTIKKVMTASQPYSNLSTHEEHPNTRSEIRISDREQLIQSIKRGENPRWIPKPSLKALYDEEHLSVSEESDGPTITQQQNSESLLKQDLDEELFFGPWAETSQVVPTRNAKSPTEAYSNLFISHDPAFGRSTLPVDHKLAEGNKKVNRRTPVPQWQSESIPPAIERAVSDPRAVSETKVPAIDTNRSRAYSMGSNCSSSFIMRTPTSPLAHGILHANTDSEEDELIPAGSIDIKHRRRTMPPDFQHSPGGLSFQTSPINFPSSSTRLQSTSQHQHQSRRSLHSFSHQASPNPLPSRARPHRPSLGSDASRRRSSLVGSFEESILRGRMSSPASRPFQFIAQIGVMGKGDCPTNLRCPPHAIVPFEAVFYSYPTSSHARSISDDAPSPYVGLLDLEQTLKPAQFNLRSSVSAATSQTVTDHDPCSTSIGRAIAQQAIKHKRASSTSTVNLGGAYRVPQQGQLQVVIKNSNKTAVKLFLIPYDLDGMGPGSKTFIRQRSYMTGPITDDAIGGSQNDISLLDPLKDKRILRYLIHVKFCCPAKGRYYLYDNIRVVFANRVPDGKEKLQNELQVPDPKYSSYQPSMVPLNSLQSSLPNDSVLEASFSLSPTAFGHSPLPHSPIAAQVSGLAPMDRVSIPFHLTAREPLQPSIPSTKPDATLSDPFRFPDIPARSQAQDQEPQRALSPVQGFLPSTSARASPVMWRGGSDTPVLRSFSPQPVEAGSGLLSRQFKKLSEKGEVEQPNAG